MCGVAYNVRKDAELAGRKGKIHTPATTFYKREKRLRSMTLTCFKARFKARYEGGK